jgi:hypothetical protein
MSDLVELEFRIHFAQMQDLPRNLAEWLSEKGLNINQVPAFHIKADVDLDDVDDEDLADAFHARFDESDFDPEWVSRAYRYLAEGDVKAAMEEMARNCLSLRSPDHELKLAAMVSPAPPSLL